MDKHLSKLKELVLDWRERVEDCRTEEYEANSRWPNHDTSNAIAKCADELDEAVLLIEAEIVRGGE